MPARYQSVQEVILVYTALGLNGSWTPFILFYFFEDFPTMGLFKFSNTVAPTLGLK